MVEQRPTNSGFSSPNLPMAYHGRTGSRGSAIPGTSRSIPREGVLRHRFRGAFHEYEIKPWYEMEPDDLARPFFDRFAALNFLRPFASDPAAMGALRELAARCSGDRSFGRLAPNHEVLLQLAWRLHERLLFLVPLEPLRDSSGPGAGTGSQTETAETQAQGSEHGRPGQADESETVRLRGPAPAPPTAPPPTPKAAAPLAGTTHWITFQLVDDETGKPIAGVDLRVALSDGNTQTYRTGADGTVHVADIPDGTCDLEELLDGQGFEVIALE